LSVLTLNAGSSSIKYAWFDGGRRLASGQVDGLGVGGAPHAQALAGLLAQSPGTPVRAIGHRIVHGGTAFDAPVLIDDAVLDAIAALAPLAPLHQPHNVEGVRAARAAFPGVPQVACFDTAFHRTMPEVNQVFALPQRWLDRGVRRYGFHGLSYESICGQLAATDAPAAQGRIVIAHLGNGASMCAVRGGRSVATTMSFSPLDGLPMGTRCGRIDAAVVLHMLQHERMSAEAIAQLLYRESGLLGMSGLSSDMRVLLQSAEPAARLALDYFVEHIGRELAALAASLRGLDMVVFTGGIGENAASLRERIVRDAAWLGIALDAEANRRGEARIAARGSRVDVRVLRTDEEAVIAQHTARVALA